MKKIGICSDHAGYELKEYLKQVMDEKGISRQDFGTKILLHPEVGELVLDWDIFRYASAPEQQLVINSAEKGSPTEKRLGQLLQQMHREESAPPSTAPHLTH